jgi:hypothetical protein
LGSFLATNYWDCFASEPYIIFSNVWFSLAPMLKAAFALATELDHRFLN